MTDQETPSLKLIVACDNTRNEYSLAGHNQTSEEVENFLDQWSRHLREGHSFLVLDQTRKHATEDAQRCRACRETVTRSAKLQPQAKFVRRKQE